MGQGVCMGLPQKKMDSQANLLCPVRFGDEFGCEGYTKRYSGHPRTVSLFPSGLFHSLPAVPVSPSGLLPLHKTEVAIGSGAPSGALGTEARCPSRLGAFSLRPQLGSVSSSLRVYPQNSLERIFCKWSGLT